MNTQTRNTVILAALISFVLGLVITTLTPMIVRAVQIQQDRAALASSQEGWAVVTLYGSQTYRLKVRQTNRICLEGSLSLPSDKRGHQAGSHTLIVNSETGTKASTLINLRDIQAATIPGVARTDLPLTACPGIISGLALTN